jgi:hypothetical protein
MLRTFIVFALIMSSCDDGGERQERVEKLRALGVVSNPAVLSPSANQGELTIHATLLPGQEVTALKLYEEDNGGPVVPVALALKPETATYTDYSQLRIFSVSATILAPPFLEFSERSPFHRLRYGVEIVAGEETEKIVGNILYYPNSAEEASWQNHTLALEKPEQVGNSGDELDLAAALTKAQEETVRIAWFVSSGKIQNRRAITTKWLDMSSGQQTVVLTARGRQSGATSFVVRDVTID